MLGRIRPKYVALGVLVYAGGVYAGSSLMNKRTDKRNGQDFAFVDEKSRHQTFSSIAHKYDKEIGFSEWTSGIIRFRKRLLESATGKVLEIAAGTGRNLEYYPCTVQTSFGAGSTHDGRTSLEIVATDFNKDMLNEADKKINKLRSDSKYKGLNVVTRVADAQNLPFENASFDTVVDTFGLCSLENPLEALQEMRRVCKPEGKILLLEHGRSNHGYGWLNNYLDKRAKQHAIDWGCWWNKDIHALVKEAGITVDHERIHHFGTCYELICSPSKSSEANL